MDVTLAHPEGYDLIPDWLKWRKTMLKPPVVASVRSPHGRSLQRRRHRLSEVMGTLQVMEERTELLRANDHEGLKAWKNSVWHRTRNTKTGIVLKSDGTDP